MVFILWVRLGEFICSERPEGYFFDFTLNRYKSYNAEEAVNASKQHREPVRIPHFSCHYLRHTFCSGVCENKTNLKVTQSILEHTNIETTMVIYAEVTDANKPHYIAVSEMLKSG